MTDPKPEPKITYRTHAAEVITLRVNHEWGFFLVDEATGLFHAQTSHGDFSYIWSHHGCASLKAFLSKLDYDYFMGKCHPKRGRRFDKELTVKRMRERILEYRKQQHISLQEARYARSAMIELDRLADSHTHEQVFFHMAYDNEDIHRAMDDFDGLAVNVRDPQCEGFWDKLWPHFIDKITPPKESANGNQP
jgi:hypothetical protein